MEQIHTPQKAVKVSPNFEEIYLAKDTDGNPLYGFSVQGHTVVQFHTYPAFSHEMIELPRLNLRDDPWVINHADMLAAQAEQAGTFTADHAPSPVANPVRDAMSSDEWLQNYANGGMTVAQGCFAGYDNLQVAVPNDYAVKLAPGCFDRHAHIELLLPADNCLKRVACSCATPHGRQSDQWLLVAHHAFNYQGTWHDLANFAAYTTSNYQRQAGETSFNVKYLPQTKLSTCTIAGHGCTYLSHLAKQGGTALRSYQVVTELADSQDPLTTRQIVTPNHER